MLSIRLKRVGRKNDPAFRVILIESHRGPQSGRVHEVLGSYNPRLKNLQLKRDRVEYWVSKGAQTSQTVKNLLRKNST